MPKYVLKPIQVDAIQLTMPLTIHDKEDKLDGKPYPNVMGQPGDWLITHEDGEHLIMSDNEFQKLYELVGAVSKPRPTRDADIEIQLTRTENEPTATVVDPETGESKEVPISQIPAPTNLVDPNIPVEQMTVEPQNADELKAAE